METFDTVLRGGTLVYPDEGTAPASLGVRDGRIAAIAAPQVELRGRVIARDGRITVPDDEKACGRYIARHPCPPAGTATAA